MLIDFGDNQMLNAISGSMIKCRDISRISVQRIKDLRERSRDSLLLAVNKLSRLNMRQQPVCFLEPKYNYNFFQCRKSWTKQNLTMMHSLYRLWAEFGLAGVSATTRSKTFCY